MNDSNGKNEKKKLRSGSSSTSSSKLENKADAAKTTDSETQQTLLMTNFNDLEKKTYFNYYKYHDRCI